MDREDSKAISFCGYVNGVTGEAGAESGQLWVSVVGLRLWR